MGTFITRRLFLASVVIGAVLLALNPPAAAGGAAFSVGYWVGNWIVETLYVFVVLVVAKLGWRLVQRVRSPSADAEPEPDPDAEAD